MRAWRHFFIFGLVIACGSVVAQQPADIPMIDIRGRIICITEEMHRLYKTELPTKHEHQYALQTTNGVIYTLLRTRLSEAIFVDERLRGKELALKGRVMPKTQIFDVTAIRSVKNGVVHDLYYYCDICDIQSVSPEICACCQGPVELIEKPLKE